MVSTTASSEVVSDGLDHSLEVVNDGLDSLSLCMCEADCCLNANDFFLYYLFWGFLIWKSPPPLKGYLTKDIF